MLKKAGMLALILSAGAAIMPSAAFAQDPYYGRGGYYYQGDRDWNRQQRREWREREREEQRWRERGWREHEWREHEWREHDRWEHRFNRGYYPDTYFYFGYGR